MKNKITKLFLAVLTLVGVNSTSYGQDSKELKNNLEATNVEFLKAFAAEKEAAFNENYQEAVRIAQQRNLEIFGEKDGYSFALVGYNKEDGTLKYYRTTNNSPTNSSLQTANAKPLQAVGINGAGMKVGVWDGGVGLTNHTAFVGGRYVIKDNGNSPSTITAGGKNHAAHVAGTVAASSTGVTKGFAPESQVYAYNWFGDVSEMAAAAANVQNPIYVSNHSYGLSAEDYFSSGGSASIFGQYNEDSRDYDLLANNAENYTIVFAAGNDRDSYSLYNPNRNGKDLLSQGGVSKNTVTVAATKGTENFTGITGNQSVSGSNQFIVGFSNFGPTDDFRIKPDIAAKGGDVTSITAAGISATATYSGTSMAAPAVTGVFTLWQQYYKQLFSNPMKSSTVRALMAHTARETGPAAGPDFMFGWGLIDADKGKQIMDQVTTEHAKVSEFAIQQGAQMVYEFTYTGTEPLVATLAWNDPAATATTSTLNVPRLVNDLDLRIFNADTNIEYFPWALVQSWGIAQTSTGISVRTGDNTRDNIEKVEVNSTTPGNYKLVVSHKGTLTGGTQKYSLIISGAGGVMPPLTGEANVEVVNALGKITLFPNPANSVLNIAGDLTILENGKLEIYDVTGKKVYVEDAKFTQNQANINIENLQNGVYILKVSSNNASNSYKFVKK